MADSYSKILRITGLILTGAGLTCSLHANDPMIGNDVSGEGMKMPVYGEDTLDYILTSKEVIKTGEIINATDPVIEFIHPEADIDDITFMEELIPYPLRTAEADVVAFWNSRLFSSAILSSPESTIDQTSSIATSEGPVYFRSPVADLNGIGYVADYQNRTVLIRSKVEMVSRPSLQSPDAITEASTLERQTPDEVLLNTLQVWSDTLFIDMNNDQVTLTGEVQLKENRLDDLRCDKMIINFESSTEKPVVEETTETANADSPETAAAETAEAPDTVTTNEALQSTQEEFSSSRKLSNIVCEGHVFIREPRGDLFCDRMTIFFNENEFGKNEIIKIICNDNIKLAGARETAEETDPATAEELSGANKNALASLGSNMSNGTLYANYGELDFPGNTGVFRGDVITVADNGSTMACDELYFYTADLAEGEVIPEQENSDEIPNRIGLTEDKELISIAAVGNVQLESDSPEDGKQVVTGSRATYTVGSREIELVDEVNGLATLIRHKDKRKYLSKKIFIDAATGDARGVDFRSLPLK